MAAAAASAAETDVAGLRRRGCARRRRRWCRRWRTLAWSSRRTRRCSSASPPSSASATWTLGTRATTRRPSPTRTCARWPWTSSGAPTSSRRAPRGRPRPRPAPRWSPPGRRDARDPSERLLRYVCGARRPFHLWQALLKATLKVSKTESYTIELDAAKAQAGRDAFVKAIYQVPRPPPPLPSSRRTPPPHAPPLTPLLTAAAAAAVRPCRSASSTCSCVGSTSRSPTRTRPPPPSSGSSTSSASRSSRSTRSSSCASTTPTRSCKTSSCAPSSRPRSSRTRRAAERPPHAHCPLITTPPRTGGRDQVGAHPVHGQRQHHRDHRGAHQGHLRHIGLGLQGARPPPTQPSTPAPRPAACPRPCTPRPPPLFLGVSGAQGDGREPCEGAARDARQVEDPLPA